MVLLETADPEKKNLVLTEYGSSFKSSTWEVETGGLVREFKASVGYRVSSRLVSAAL